MAKKLKIMITMTPIIWEALGKAVEKDKFANSRSAFIEDGLLQDPIIRKIIKIDEVRK